MEKFDEIWLLHHTYVWFHHFRRFLILFQSALGVIGFRTIGSHIILYGHIVFGTIGRGNSLIPVFINDVLLQVFIFKFVGEESIGLHVFSELLLVPPGELIIIHFNQGNIVEKTLIFFFFIAINRGVLFYLVLFPVIHSNHYGFSLLVDISFDLMRCLFAAEHH